MTSADLLETLGCEEKIQIMDVGASVINETPVYKPLLDLGIGHLNAFEGDKRQTEKIRDIYGDKCSLYDDFVFDGGIHTLYVCTPQSGMTSLFKPRQQALNFFNGFDRFGSVLQTMPVQTVTMDSIQRLPKIDFLKMDIQGAELEAMQHGTEKLTDCLAVQLEVSFIGLYEKQPSFGQIDTWMRSQGYHPHCFLEVKRWSITPTIFSNNFRVPGNQLLEADIVYIKDPLNLQVLSDLQLKKLMAIVHCAFRSIDLCVHLMLELQSRGALAKDTHLSYLAWANEAAKY